MNSDLTKRDPLRYYLFFAFFLTGATGLVYQVLWSRLLVFSFGYTIFSISIVITAFMGGLALGSAIGGVLADRVKNLVSLYGMAEIGIGAIAIITYPLLMAMPYGIAEYREALNIPYYGLSPWTMLIAMCILVPPTFLMGLTLPILAKVLTRVKESAAMDIGALYALNTLGAAGGAILAGFLLIGLLGLYKTLLLAAAVNIIIGVVAIYFGRSYKRPLTKELTYEGGDEGFAAPARSILKEPVFWSFGVSGFTALACEVVWIRLFSPYLENSTYAFSLILGIFLLGIAFGGWAARRVGAKMSSSLFGFSLCQILTGFATAIGLLGFFVFISFNYKLLPQLGLLVGDPSIILSNAFGIFLIVIPSTFFMGAGFPFIARWAAGEFKSLGGRTGKLYASNTVGSIFGALLGGFVLLPTLGTRNSLIFLVSVFILNGIYLLYMSRAQTRRAMRVILASVIVLVCVIVAFRVLPDPNIYALNSAYPGHNVVSYIEDADVNVAMLESAKNKDAKSLHLNMRLVSGTGLGLTPWMSYLPILMFDGGEPKRMLNIGLGVGHTLMTASKKPGLEIDVAELVPSVVTLFKEYNPEAEKILANERVNIILGDGRNILLSAESGYDIITIDPTPPLYGSGAVNLYTADFFTVILEKLSEKGVLLLRIPASADESAVKLLIKTSLMVFPNVSLWQPPFKGRGYSLIASKHDYQMTKEDIANEVRSADFLDDGWKKLLLETQPILIGEEIALVKFTKDVPVVTDDMPYLEFPLLYKFD